MSSNSWGKIIDKFSDEDIKKGLTSFVNPFSMLVLEKNIKIAEGIDHWFMDGISLVNKINKAFGTKWERASFDDTSLAPKVFEFSKKNNLKIAIIGTMEAYISKAVSNIEKKFSVKVSYSRNGYFTTPEEKDEALNYIINNNIEVVVVGMGTPYQEQFLIELKNRNWNGYGFTCGGYLHQMAKSDNYYPAFFDKMNIRWVYRIIDEPKLLKRYAFYYPLFFLKLNKFIKQVNHN